MKVAPLNLMLSMLLLSTVGLVTLGHALQLPAGDILVVDFSAGTNNAGAVFLVDQATGTRNLISDFGSGNPRGKFVDSVAIESSGNFLIPGANGFGPGQGLLFRVDPTGDPTSNKTIVSDFGNPTQGPLGSNTLNGIVIDNSGMAFVLDRIKALLFSVDTTTGNRTILSDFSNIAQGPLGFRPFGLAVDSSGNFLVTDLTSSTTVQTPGVLFSVNPISGNRTIISDFRDVTQGPLGQKPTGVTVLPSGNIIVADAGSGVSGSSCGTDNPPGPKGVLFSINPTTGTRIILSDFNDSAQGPLGENPTGVAIVPPTVTIAATDSNASETGPDSGSFTVSRTGTTTNSLTVFYSLSGTATAASDYVALSGSVVIPIGQDSATITVTPIDDAVLGEGDETVIATLTLNTSYIIGSPSSATVTITDNDIPTVTIAATDSNASETGPDSGSFTVSRTGTTTNSLTVFYSLSGTATAASDYVALSGSVVIPIGQDSTTITVTPIDDVVEGEGDETVLATLTLNAYYIIGSPSSATVTIWDNDAATAPRKITDLKAASFTQTTITLNWTAPGDDSNAGIAASYDLRFSTVRLSDANWDAATQVIGESAPLVAGSFESFTVTGLLCGNAYYFGIKTLDEVNNTSVLSNIDKRKTERCNKLQVHPTTMPTGEIGVSYNSGVFDITGGAAPYDVQIDPATLPPGISYGSQTFTGTPTEAKNWSIVGVVTDNVGSVAKLRFRLKIVESAVITTKSLRVGKINAKYSAVLRAKEGIKDYSWSLAPTSAALPGNLSLDSATGRLSGVVSAPVTVDVDFRVTDALGGTDNQTLTLTFN